MCKTVQNENLLREVGVYKCILLSVITSFNIRITVIHIYNVQALEYLMYVRNNFNNYSTKTERLRITYRSKTTRQNSVLQINLINHKRLFYTAPPVIPTAKQ